MNRYAAKLLFQWNPEPNERPRALRLCEDRIIALQARTAHAALTKAKAAGRRAEFKYRYVAGVTRFQFVGVLQLMKLGVETGPNEVWWELSRRLRPMERRRQLLPPERELIALRDERIERKLKPTRPRRRATGAA